MISTYLGTVCDIEMGQAPDGSSYNDSGEGYPLLAGASDFGVDSPIPSKFTTAPTKLSKPGDLLLCIRATIGDLNWSDKQYCLGRGVAGLRPKNKNTLDRRYLWRWLSFARPELEKRGRGSTFKQVSRQDICDLEILLPHSLDEQRRIADLLDKADAIRRKRKEAVALAEELLRSAFLEVFGEPVANPKNWPQSTFGEQLELLEYGPRFYNGKYSESGVRIVRITDLDTTGRLDFTAMPRLTVDERDRSRYVLRPGDLIFARTGATVGKTAISMPGDPEAIPGAYFIRLRFKPRVRPMFARQVLASDRVQRMIASRSRQSAQQNFSGPGIRELPLPLPPVPLQERFEEFVQARLALIRDCHRARVDSEELFRSLLQRTFSSRQLSGGWTA